MVTTESSSAWQKGWLFVDGVQKNRPADSPSVKVSGHSLLFFGLLTWSEVNAAIMKQTVRIEDQAIANAPLWLWILVQSMKAWSSHQSWYLTSCVSEDVGGPVGYSWCHHSDILLIISPDDVVISYSGWDAHAACLGQSVHQCKMLTPIWAFCWFHRVAQTWAVESDRVRIMDH